MSAQGVSAEINIRSGPVFVITRGPCTARRRCHKSQQWTIPSCLNTIPSKWFKNRESELPLTFWFIISLNLSNTHLVNSHGELIWSLCSLLPAINCESRADNHYRILRGKNIYEFKDIWALHSLSCSKLRIQTFQSSLLLVTDVHQKSILNR